MNRKEKGISNNYGKGSGFMEIKLSRLKLVTICFLLICATLFPNMVGHVRAANSDTEETGAYVQYNFNNHLTDLKNHSTLTAWSSANSQDRSNASTSFGSDNNGNYWQWHSNTNRGGGFWIDIDKNIGEEYTIGLKFSFENTLGGWRKIIDYKNSAVDTGFYFYQGGHLNFYNYGVNGASITQPNQVVDMIVRRNKNKSFEAYIVDSHYDKKLDMKVIDSQDQGVPTAINGKTRLGFFFDDIATSAEASPGGKVYTLKIWDSYMDPDDVIEELKPKGYVNVHYVDEDGDKIIPDEKMEGFVGDPYSVQEKTMYGFEYLRNEGKPKTGKYPDGEEYDVTFVYKVTLPYSVTARYVDEAGNQLCENIIYRDELGKQYKTEQLEIKGYEFVKIEGNDTGTIKKHPQIVTYVYKKIKEAEEQPDKTIGVVNAQYVDETGTTIRDDIVYKGYVNTDYQTAKLIIPGYKFKEVVGDENGKYAKTPIDVKYIYTKVEDIPEENIGGSVVVHYQDKDGNTIRTDDIFNGNIGENYQVIKYNIPKYKFDRIIGEEKGEIEKNVKVITVIYVPIASNVIARYVDENGNTIESDKIYSGGIGQKYQTEKKNIKGWKFEKVEGRESGLFSDEVQVIKYVYKRVGNLIVRCVDIYGNQIINDKVYTDYVNKDYSMTPPELNSYELVRVNGNETGKYQIGDQVLEYVYEKFIQGTVIIQCVDEKGNKIVNDRNIVGKVGTPYEISIPNIHGYEYIKTVGQASGEYKEEKNIVKFVYKLVMPCTVTAKYVDEDNKELCTNIIYKGREGENYKTTQLEISGYDFVRVEGDKEGKFREKPQLVTYVYKKKVVSDENGKVISKYVDEDGNTLYNDLIYSGRLGDNYKTSQLSIPGYRFKEVIGDETNVYQKKQQEVKYVYIKINPDDMTEEDEKIGGSVLVRYEDEKGNIIKEDDIYNGNVGEKYKAEKAELTDYDFVKVIGEEQGEIEKGIKVITYVYKSNESKVQASTVIAKYVDVDGNIIHFDNIYNGFIGEQYKTNAEKIKGYELVKVEGKENGTFAEDVNVVTYIYKEIGRITIRYVDENGNVIKEQDTYSSVVGAAYKFNHPNIAGYRYVRVEGKTKGYYTKNDQNITFVYKKIKNKNNNDDKANYEVMGDKYESKTPKTSDESTPYLYMLLSLVSMIGIIGMIKKRKKEAE